MSARRVRPRLPIGPLEAWLNARYANSSPAPDVQLGGRLIGPTDRRTARLRPVAAGRGAVQRWRAGGVPLYSADRAAVARRRPPRRDLARVPHHRSTDPDGDHLPHRRHDRRRTARSRRRRRTQPQRQPRQRRLDPARPRPHPRRRPARSTPPSCSNASPPSTSRPPTTSLPAGSRSSPTSPAPPLDSAADVAWN